MNETKLSILKPKVNPIRVKGSLIYNESCRSRNIIRLKKEIRDEFTDLQDKNKLFSYSMEYYRSYQELLKRIQEIIVNDEGLPFLLYLYEGDKNAEPG